MKKYSIILSALLGCHPAIAGSRCLSTGRPFRDKKKFNIMQKVRWFSHGMDRDCQVENYFIILKNNFLLSLRPRLVGGSNPLFVYNKVMRLLLPLSRNRNDRATISSLKFTMLLLMLAFTQLTFGQAQTSDIASVPGAFSRMGFGARGIGMGNAMSAVKHGSLVSYYNPALGAFQEKNNFHTSYSILSLDRSLNFLNFTKTFPLGTKQNEKGENVPRSIAGFSAGIINAGVSDIPKYDGTGTQTGDLSTSENQFFFSVSNRFSEKLAIGIAFKFYYYKLYEDITSTSLGFDLGALYSLNDNITISAVLTDINTKYKWDTSEIYGTNGKTTEDKFPLLKKLGVAYKFDEQKLIASVEIESSNAETTFLRFGAEYNIVESLYLRGGLDKWNLQNSDFPVRPSFGFSYFYKLNNLVAGIDYAFVIEPYSSSDQHIIGVNINF